MLSIFPNLFFLEGFAPLFLRLTLGAVFILWAYGAFKKSGSYFKPLIAILEGVIGIFLVLGFLTQIAALVSAILLAVRLGHKIKQKAFFTDGINYYFILFIISVCLILTGPGFFAADLPL